MSEQTQQFLIVSIAMVLIIGGFITCTTIRGFRQGSTAYCMECSSNCEACK